MAENRERRDLLRDAAIDVLAEEGAHRLTHRWVDQAANVPAGTTKNYFPTRNALLEAAAQRCYQRYRDDVAKLEALDIGPADRTQLRTMLAEVLRRGTATDRPRLMATLELHAEATRNPTVRALLAKLTETDFMLYERLQRAAQLPVTPPKARTVTRSLHAALLSLLTHPPESLPSIGLDDLDRFVAEVLDAVYPES